MRGLWYSVNISFEKWLVRANISLLEIWLLHLWFLLRCVWVETKPGLSDMGAFRARHTRICAAVDHLTSEQHVGLPGSLGMLIDIDASCCLQRGSLGCLSCWAKVLLKWPRPRILPVQLMCVNCGCQVELTLFLHLAAGVSIIFLRSPYSFLPSLAFYVSPALPFSIPLPSSVSEWLLEHRVPLARLFS